MRNHVRFDKETGKFYQGKVKRSLKNGCYLYRVFHNGNESERIAHTNKRREVSLAVIGSSPVHSTINPLLKAKVNSQGQTCADLSKNKFALLTRED